MCKRIHILSFLSILLFMLAGSIAAAEPVSDAVQSEVKEAASHHRDGKKHRIDSKDAKVSKREPLKRIEGKDSELKPVPDSPVPERVPLERPPKVVPKDKIKPIKDGEVVRRGHGPGGMKPALKLKKKSKSEKEFSSEQKDCRAERDACRRECKAAKKQCGSEDCASELAACKKSCSDKYNCR